MAYLAKNHKSNNSKDIQTGYANNRNNKVYNNQGYQNSNFGKQVNNGNLSEKINNLKAKNKKEQAKKEISKSISAVNPIAGFAADKALETKRGQKVLDAYAKADSPSEGVANAKKEINRQKRQIKLIGIIILISLPLILLVFFLSIFAKNADSQIYSNENDGTVESDNYKYDDKDTNIFANYPGLYEKIVDTVIKVSDEYQVEIDKYLIIATLISPIENGLIVPIEDESKTTCGEKKCYYFNGEQKTWKEFLKIWGDQSELLAKMQMLTYTNNENGTKVNCGEEETMEQYAQNDYEIKEKYAFWWINPLNWFSNEFRNASEAEVNAKCVKAKSGDSVIPDVRMLSVDQGEYYVSTIKDGEYEYVKDPNSGGVYFWNLLNKKGFIHEYLKDYLSDEYKDDEDKNYEVNKKTIIETTNYIYSYYESIRKDCNGFPVMKGELEKIKFKEDANAKTYTLDFEDIFVGGSVLATYGGASGETAKAQAILTRSEAYNYIVEQHQDVIVGSAKMGCWWWKYNPTYDPSYENQEDNPNYDPDYPKVHFPEIYKAVTETRGIVVTDYGGTKVLETEYDAFCPTTSEPVGGFYYLPEGQRNLPIENSYLTDASRNRAKCPCFKHGGAQPGPTYAKTLYDLTQKHVGDPPQTTNEACWNTTGATKREDDGTILSEFEYHATGGHGRGVSQHGMAYFSRFGYDRFALIKLFLERDNYGVSFKRLDNTIEEGECINHGYYKKDTKSGSDDDDNDVPSGDYNSDSNYNKEIGGTPLGEGLTKALKKNGYSIDDLNKCIGDRVTAAGYGTRAGVVEAAVGLLQCTMDMTGGYTYPYDHYGGAISPQHPDINGKLGVNSRWGEVGGSGRFGLNCANFVRWAMCNGGMDLCDKGSTYAQGMFSTQFFPGATMVLLSPGFKVVTGSISVSSQDEAFDKIQPGDVLFSNLVSGGAGHIMVIVGKTDHNITIAENGRKTRVIPKAGLFDNRNMTYSVLLLDNYYAKSSNKNKLSW